MFRRQQHASTIRLVAIASAFAMSTSSISMAQSSETPPKEPIIESTGTGRVQRAPDRVDISVGVEVAEETASAAHASSERIMKAAVAAIRELKLAGEELQTGSVELSPRYERVGSSQTPTRIIGYTGSISLTVRTTHLEAPAGVIDAALKAGCNRVNYVSFTLKELLEAREEAIKLATRAAKRKAEVMADALDMKLVRVARANTSNVNQGWWGANRFSNMAQVATGNNGGDGGDGSALVPGQIEVTAEVSVSFVAAAK